MFERIVFRSKLHLAELLTCNRCEAIAVVGIFAIFYLGEINRIIKLRDDVDFADFCFPVSRENDVIL